MNSAPHNNPRSSHSHAIQPPQRPQPSQLHRLPQPLQSHAPARSNPPQSRPTHSYHTQFIQLHSRQYQHRSSSNPTSLGFESDSDDDTFTCFNSSDEEITVDYSALLTASKNNETLTAKTGLVPISSNLSDPMRTHPFALKTSAKPHTKLVELVSSDDEDKASSYSRKRNKARIKEDLAPIKSDLLQLSPIHPTPTRSTSHHHADRLLPNQQIYPTLLPFYHSNFASRTNRLSTTTPPSSSSHPLDVQFPREINFEHEFITTIHNFISIVLELNLWGDSFDTLYHYTQLQQFISTQFPQFLSQGPSHQEYQKNEKISTNTTTRIKQESLQHQHHDGTKPASPSTSETPSSLNHLQAITHSLHQLISELPFALLKQFFAFQNDNFPTLFHPLPPTHLRHPNAFYNTSSPFLPEITSLYAHIPKFDSKTYNSPNAQSQFIQQSPYLASTPPPLATSLPFHLFHAYPQRFQQFQQQPFSPLLSASFFNTIISNLAHLLQTSFIITPTTMFTLPNTPNLLRTLFHTFCPTYASPPSQPSTAPIHHPTPTAVCLDFLLKSPQQVLHALKHFFPHYFSTTMQFLQSQTTILHFIFSIFNFSAFTLPITSRYLFLLQFIQHTSLPINSPPRSQKPAMSTHPSTSDTSKGQKHTAFSNSKLKATSPFYAPLPVSLLDSMLVSSLHILTNLIEGYCEESSSPNQHSSPTSLSPSHSIQPTPNSIISNHRSSQPSSSSIQLTPNTNIPSNRNNNRPFPTIIPTSVFEFHLFAYLLTNSPSFESAAFLLPESKTKQTVKDVERCFSNYQRSASCMSTHSTDQSDDFNEHITKPCTDFSDWNAFFSFFMLPLFHNASLTTYPAVFLFDHIANTIFNSINPQQTTTQSHHEPLLSNPQPQPQQPQDLQNSQESTHNTDFSNTNFQKHSNLTELTDFSPITTYLDPLSIFPQTHAVHSSSLLTIATTTPNSLTPFQTPLAKSLILSILQKASFQTATHSPIANVISQLLHNQNDNDELGHLREFRSNENDTGHGDLNTFRNNAPDHAAVASQHAGDDMSRSDDGQASVDSLFQQHLIAQFSEHLSEVNTSATSTPDDIFTISPHSLTSMFFPSDLFDSITQSLQMIIQNEHNTTTATTTDVNNGSGTMTSVEVENTRSEETSYLQYNPSTHTKLEFPILNEVIAAAIETITNNLYSALLATYQQAHFFLSLSHLTFTSLSNPQLTFAYLSQHRPTSGPHKQMYDKLLQNSTFITNWSQSLSKQLYFSQWLKAVATQHNIMSSFSNIRIYITAYSLDLRDINTSSDLQLDLNKHAPNATSSMIDNDAANRESPKTHSSSKNLDINRLTFESQPFSSSLSTTPQLATRRGNQAMSQHYLDLMRFYHQMYSKIAQSLYPSHFLSPLPQPSFTTQQKLTTTAILHKFPYLLHLLPLSQTLLVSLLLTQHTDIVASPQHQLISPFFYAIELQNKGLLTRNNISNTTSSSTNQSDSPQQLTKRQRQLVSTLPALPTIAVELHNHHFFTQSASSSIQIPLTRPPTLRFVFPYQMPSQSQRTSARTKIYDALQHFVQLNLYNIFVDYDPGLISTLQTTIAMDEFSLEQAAVHINAAAPTQPRPSFTAPFSHCLQKLEELLYVKTSSIPWLFDVSFFSLSEPTFTNYITPSNDQLPPASSTPSNTNSSTTTRDGTANQTSPRAHRSAASNPSQNQTGDEIETFGGFQSVIKNQMLSYSTLKVGATVLPLDICGQFMNGESPSADGPVKINNLPPWYRPGLELTSQCQFDCNNTENSLSQVNSRSITNSTLENQPELPSQREHAGTIAVIQYKQYLIYLSALIETLALVKSLGTVLPDSILTPLDAAQLPAFSANPHDTLSDTSFVSLQSNQPAPSSSNSLATINTSRSHLRSPDNGQIETTNQNAPISSQSGAYFDLYSIPYFFPTARSSFQKYLEAVQQPNGTITPHSTSTLQSSSAASLQIPVPSVNASNITIALTNFAPETYRSSLVSILSSNWALFLITTLFNPTHLFALNTLYLDGGTAAHGVLSTFQSEQTRNVIIKPEHGQKIEPKFAPQCNQCHSSDEIYLLTVSSAPTSTKTEIYGSDDLLVEKFTCKRCNISWIVKS